MKDNIYAKIDMAVARKALEISGDSPKLYEIAKHGSNKDVVDCLSYILRSYGFYDVKLKESGEENVES